MDEETPLNPHNEIKGLLIFGASVLILLSLLSYSSGHEASNWLGLFGFYCSLSFLYAFGLTSYLLVAALAWIGIRQVIGRSMQDSLSKGLFFLLLIVSLCVLQNLAAETWPKFGQILEPFTYSQKLVRSSFLSNTAIRHNVGGVPFYFLLKDLPKGNLIRLFSPVGITLIFGTSLFVSFLLLTRIRIISFFSYFGAKISQLISYILTKKEREEKLPKEPKPTPLTPDQGAPGIFKKVLAFLKGLLPFKKRDIDTDFDSFPFNEPDTPEEREIENFDTAPVPITRKGLTPRPLPNLHSTPSSSIKKEPPPTDNQSIEETSKITNYSAPSLSLLQNAKKVDRSILKRFLSEQAQILEETLQSFGIDAKVRDINAGPTIISYEVIPSSGVKVQKIRALENDIALKLKAKCIRIIAPIPGRAAVGIEVPNPAPQEVGFKELMSYYKQSGSHLKIPILLGKSVLGEHVIADLTKMPHCIIAGATGSGKSVCINAFIMSILMNSSPSDIRLLLVDPKKVELSAYSNLPHMISPVVTESAEALYAMKWLVREMEWRYELFKQVRMRNILAFNTRKVDEKYEASLQIDVPKKLPYYVCIIDELADLMMVAGNEIEAPIARVAQMARAVGIHLVLATQRPSREVITGLIKANFPTRIAFKVASRVNSQIILDDIGAESLLGNGDMLFLAPGSASPIRAQGAYIKDDDILNVIDSITRKYPTHYLVQNFSDTAINVSDRAGISNELDSLFENAKALVIATQNASTTFLQRKLKVGYARAASIMDQLEEHAIIGPQDGSKPRKVLVNTQSADENS